MSDSEENEGNRKEVEAMPPHKIRFTDLEGPLVEKAIRCK